MKTFVITFLAFILVLLVSTVVLAQPEIPIPMLPKAPDLAPIDGGLAVLATAGGVYAWKKLRNKKD